MTDPQPLQVDVGLVRELAELLDQTNLTEIEVEDGGRRIRVARTPAPVAAAVPAAAVATAAAPAAIPAATTPTSAAADELAGAVRSPIVGTAYLSPEPGAPPFVREGQMVAEGDTLLIIEAMKVMNAIPAPRAGRVTRVLIAHETPVEYDQPLIVIA